VQARRRRGPVNRTCVECGEQFGSQHPRSLYCSRTCKWKANRQSRALPRVE
jgi:hypothetical protein